LAHNEAICAWPITGSLDGIPDTNSLQQIELGVCPAIALSPLIHRSGAYCGDAGWNARGVQNASGPELCPTVTIDKLPGNAG
jgi:hypothetical protein